MRTREITVFSTSFLDLLSCGFGAVILLCLVFAASKVSQGRVRGETTMLRIRSVGATGEPAPLLGVYIEMGDLHNGLLVAGGQPLVEAGYKLSILPQELGKTEYTLVLTGERFGPRDRVFVFVFDFAEAPRSTFTVTVETFGKGRSERGQEQLKPGAAIRSFSLEGLEASPFSFRWQ